MRQKVRLVVKNYAHYNAKSVTSPIWRELERRLKTHYENSYRNIAMIEFDVQYFSPDCMEISFISEGRSYRNIDVVDESVVTADYTFRTIAFAIRRFLRQDFIMEFDSWERDGAAEFNTLELPAL